jgi:hypothetical protein
MPGGHRTSKTSPTVAALTTASSTIPWGSTVAPSLVHIDRSSGIRTDKSEGRAGPAHENGDFASLTGFEYPVGGFGIDARHVAGFVALAAVVALSGCSTAGSDTDDAVDDTELAAPTSRSPASEGGSISAATGGRGGSLSVPSRTAARP